LHLMTWEVNPRMRNKNNLISFIAKNNILIKEGDVIVTNISGDTCSVYTITKIEETRPAAMSEHNHFKARTFYRQERYEAIAEALIVS
ncbi:hypothetical protein ACFSTE_15920, partial [Aquimarina hainanensis]